MPFFCQTSLPFDSIGTACGLLLFLRKSNVLFLLTVYRMKRMKMTKMKTRMKKTWMKMRNQVQRRGKY